MSTHSKTDSQVPLRSLSMDSPGHESNERNDDGKEYRARQRGPESQATVLARLRQEVAERGAERPSEDIGDPEGEHLARIKVADGGSNGDYRTENDDSELKPEAERFGGKVAGRRAQGKGAEDRSPVEKLAAAGEDAADRERALSRVPRSEDAGERHGEHRGAEIEAHAESIGERIGDLRADDAHENDREPVDPGHIAIGAQLQDHRR